MKFPAGFHYKKASEPLYKTPKSIQETIEIMAVAENGIFEVSKNKYSKCYRFQDINYTTATEDEQIGIFERYCKFLNSLDCNYKITINNKNKNMDELRDKVLIAEKNNGFNNYRRIYNDIIEEKIIEGRHGNRGIWTYSGRGPQKECPAYKTYKPSALFPFL